MCCGCGMLRVAFSRSLPSQGLSACATRSYAVKIEDIVSPSQVSDPFLKDFFKPANISQLEEMYDKFVTLKDVIDGKYTPKALSPSDAEFTTKVNELKKTVKDPAVVKQFENLLQNPGVGVQRAKDLYKDVDLKQLISQMKDDLDNLKAEYKKLTFLQNVLDDKVVPTAQNVAEIIGSDVKTVEESLNAELPKYLLDQEYFKKYESKLTPDLRKELQKLESLIVKA